MEATKRALYERALGRWLRRRLDAARHYHEVPVPLARGGPGLDGLRIALLSDTHAGAFMGSRELSRICERVARAEPDLVCLGGDLIEDRPEQIIPLAKAISLLRPPLGVFAVPGNHDYDADPALQMWRAVLEEHGVTVLINQGLRVQRAQDSLWIAGVDDLGRGRPDLPRAMEGAREEEPVVLLSHHPDLFCEAAYLGVDLTLSGHTHAGQITFFGRTPLRHSQLGYWRGRFEEQGAQLYVSGGVGITGLPLRVHAPGEVPLIRLRIEGD